MSAADAARSDASSTRTVVVAFGANLCVALAKTAAAIVSGSASMLAESAHSWADTGNQIFLLIANRRSVQPADIRHPIGHRREAYVWSLLAAVGMFFIGAAVSVWHGIAYLVHEPSTTENYAVAYGVLGTALLFEGASFVQATDQLRAEARRFDLDLLEHALATSDPTTRAVFAEDSAALVGLVVALAGIGLHQLTGNAVFDAVGSILIGLLLGVVALVLVDRNRRFLTGEPASSAVYAAARQRLEALPEVNTVRFLRLEFIGPKQLFLVASVDLVGDESESQVARRLRALERAVEQEPLIADALLTVSDLDFEDER